MLDSLLDSIRHRSRTFRVYRSDNNTDLEEQFASHLVDIDTRSLPPDGPDPFVVIEADGAFAGALSLERFEALLEPPIVRPGGYGKDRPGASLENGNNRPRTPLDSSTNARDDIPDGYRVLFDVLGDTVFTAMERRQLLAVSREIEDRAFRVGTGTLRVGFQTLSTFKSQVEMYRYLATETDLDIHIYGVSDWNPPEIDEITYHPLTDDSSTLDSLERYWLLAFDGGPTETQACGLLAQERLEGYDGFWTDDATIVRRIEKALHESHPKR